MGRLTLEDGPGGPFRFLLRRSIIESRMPLHDDIAQLLRMPENGAGAPSIDAIETTLTDGYAEALALQAERSRIERRLGEVARDAGEVSAHSVAAELSELSERIKAVDGELARLRALLHELQVVRRRRRASAPAA